MSPGTVALLVAIIAAAGGLLAKRYETRASTKTTVQEAVAKTLDQVWEQRLVFRDEQIADLRAELAEQATKHTQEIAKLSREIQRLTALVLKLGGTPHDQ